MKDAIKRRLDWVAGSWVAQVVFFAAGSVVCLRGLSSGHASSSAQLYLSISVFMLVLSAVNAIVALGHIRSLFGLFFVILNTFILPFSLNSYGLPLNYVALAGMLFAMAVIAIAPRFVGVGTILASAAFACYLHYDSVVFNRIPLYDRELAALERRLVTEGESPIQDGSVKVFKVSKDMTLKELSGLKEVYGDPLRWEVLYKANKSRLAEPDKPVVAGTALLVPKLPEVTVKNVVYLAAWYLAGGIVAFFWRLLVGKMLELYSMAMSNTSKAAQGQINDLNAQLDSSKKEFRLIKEEMALQIIEMNKITGFKK